MKACHILLTTLLLAAPAMAQTAPLASAPRASAPLQAEPELPATDLLLRYESPALSFRWSLAPEAALEPALVTQMRTEALADRQKTIREADEAFKAAAGGRQYQTQWLERWKPQAETDQLLALSAQQYSFTGGAHGNLLMRGVIWDRGAGRRISFGELFKDEKAAMAALKPAFCKALDAERADRRQGQKLEGFTDCPDPSAYPILPVGDGRIGSFLILVPPYEAGPWAEGVYEITVDADPFTAFVLPRYLPAFTRP
ncbi:DUF4163 domain-containing protein [Sandaracinobacter neustonicus]|uniref:DUF4163 domain-containing protein n=1 Tax=Sandaracinobacter neustonicus TaxID=1715348 RepID=A0A501XVF0_9SPHN|nr:DUF3298 and DUF4163 domain-containing protein [Sandaracinobacter neustonicus]TPE64485.1 DUF4163 domain-containing protein [Sandaracinobacter neustonicus]